jgi:hypothetical protein
MSCLPVVDRLRQRFGMARMCVVADRGMISAETMAEFDARWHRVHSRRARALRQGSARDRAPRHEADGGARHHPRSRRGDRDRGQGGCRRRMGTGRKAASLYRREGCWDGPRCGRIWRRLSPMPGIGTNGGSIDRGIGGRP